MQLLNKLLLLLIATVSAAVLDVSEFSYDELLNKNVPTFLLFYAWGHEAVALNGYYSDLSRIYENDNVVFARIDVGENPELASKFTLPKVPSVAFYHPGADPEIEILDLPPIKAVKQKIRHDLGIDHTNDHTNYPLNQLTDNTFRLGIQGKEALVLFTGSCPNCEKIVGIFRQIAADYKYSSDVAIADVDPTRLDSRMLADVFSISHYPTVLYFSHEGSKIPLRPQLYTGETTYEAITEFLESHGVSPVTRLQRVVATAKRVWKMLSRPRPPQDDL